MIDEDKDFGRVLSDDDPDRAPVGQRFRSQRNPRVVFTDPDSFFGVEFYHDLLMEQQEQG